MATAGMDQEGHDFGNHERKTQFLNKKVEGLRNTTGREYISSGKSTSRDATATELRQAIELRLPSVAVRQALAPSRHGIDAMHK